MKTSVTTSLLALIRLNVRQTLTGKKMWIVLLFVLLPSSFCAMSVNAHREWPPDDLLNMFAITAVGLFVHLLVPIVTLLLAATSIVDEIEDHTLPYLLIRPIPRWLIVIGKYLSSTFFSASILTLGLLAAFATSFAFGHFHEMQLYWRTFIHAWIACVGGVMVYGAIFQTISLLTMRVFILGFIYFIVENILSSIPSVAQRISAMHYIRSLLSMDKAFSEIPVFKIINADPAGIGLSLVVLIAYAAVFVVISGAIMHLREFETFKGGNT